VNANRDLHVLALNSGSAANAKQKEQLAALSSRDFTASKLAGEKIDSIIDRAPGDNAPIGGIRVSSAGGWFAARPSRTEDIYKDLRRELSGRTALQQILKEAQASADAVISPQ
jgi:phosphoglucomutase